MSTLLALGSKHVLSIDFEPEVIKKKDAEAHSDKESYQIMDMTNMEGLKDG